MESWGWLARLLAALLFAVAAAGAQMKVHYINVGQADAALLEFRSGAILIDAGGEETANDFYRDHLVGYLREFFIGRPDLNRTLNSIIVTHPHIDHTRYIIEVMENFRVKALIDGGGKAGNGMGPLRRARDLARSRGIRYESVRDHRIPGNGFTSRAIDPFPVRGSDPDIRILAGSRGCQNKNNDSLVVLVRFKGAAFLFPGDAESEDDEECAAEIPLLIARFRGNRLLDVDVYKVGNHGSAGATTKELMEAMTPQISIISAGHHSREAPGPFHAWQYGHPRESAVKLLEEGTSGQRPQSKHVHIMAGPERVFFNRRMQKAVYCTCWDGDIVVSVGAEGSGLSVQTSNP